jgi:hypothetical protein
VIGPVTVGATSGAENVVEVTGEAVVVVVVEADWSTGELSGGALSDGDGSSEHPTARPTATPRVAITRKLNCTMGPLRRLIGRP